MANIQEIVKVLNISNAVLNKPDADISEVKQASENTFNDSDILWVSEKNTSMLSGITAGTIICSVNTPGTEFNSNCNYLLTDKPRAKFQQLLNHFFVEKAPVGISASASIHPSVTLGSKIFIGHNVVIEENCKIGNGSYIGHNTVIYKNTILGSNVKLGSNNTIGGVGFGYEKDDDGTYVLIPHIGNVVLRDGVEIGNNTTVDRGVIGSTILNENVKVDNLVHIAHGVVVGENSLVIANAMVAGSVKIGKNSWIAPSSSILNNKTIGDNCVIGMGAVVLKSVPDNDVVVGNPSKSLKSRS